MMTPSRWTSNSPRLLSASRIKACRIESLRYGPAASAPATTTGSDVPCRDRDGVGAGDDPAGRNDSFAPRGAGADTPDDHPRRSAAGKHHLLRAGTRQPACSRVDDGRLPGV